MTKHINVSLRLEELNRKQREGIDQSSGYNSLFNANYRVVQMAKMDAVKEKIQEGAFYLSRLKSETADDYLVIDMHAGHVYKMKSSEYLVEVSDDNILVTDSRTGEEMFLIDDGKLEFADVKHLGEGNYMYMSGDRIHKGIPALRINNNYASSIRIHWIIVLMKRGIEILDKCVGDNNVHRLRRKVAFKKSEDNSISNLEIKFGTDNYKGEDNR